MWKGNPAWDLLAQEFAKWRPALANMIFEKIFGANKGTSLLVVFVKDAFSVVGEVTFPEGFEKDAQQSMVIGGSPVNVGKQTKLGLGRAPVQSLHRRSEIISLRIHKQRGTFQSPAGMMIISFKDITHRYQESTSRFKRTTLAFGYAFISSGAKIQAGQSHTAYR